VYPCFVPECALLRAHGGWWVQNSGTSGNVEIDGIPIDRLGLRTLRSRVLIVPQDPVLFSGTVRSNLDPFGTFVDGELWAALEASSLGALVPLSEWTIRSLYLYTVDRGYPYDSCMEEPLTYLSAWSRCARRRGS
jgi:hypothetical protein